MSYSKRIAAAVLVAGAVLGVGALPASAADRGYDHGHHRGYHGRHLGYHGRHLGYHHDRDGWRHGGEGFRGEGWRHDHEGFRGWRHGRHNWR
ncbi:hypothetical protein [Streptomyces noursei]|uniref:hypothetical protein n=1 Tax=Streptomyces noursei TaxID=1971 RepID=UPI0019634E6D|nr:hypothetical protein [Streptomyces noursei]QRX96421.1 hypothetical protein JNO44_41540 [Streptomyces noursei]